MHQHPEPNNLPRHIAIIMDGNGRWAKKRGLPRVAGHRAGVHTVRRVVKACGEWGIKVLTLYTFSTENWKRPMEEVSALMSLLLETLRKETDDLHKKNVRMRVMGNLEKIPDRVRNNVHEAVERTRDNTGLILNLALNYGAREEIVRAVQSIGREIRNGTLRPDEIDQAVLSRSMYTQDLPDPDLLIRTSGEYRISNFLLWQIAYTELYVTSVLWPDFGRKDLQKAIENFRRRERRFGSVIERADDGPLER
ncbi:MAG TPA: isoprenyl transferase [bacterium]|nr:isoprenyl transferase [bacterium]